MHYFQFDAPHPSVTPAAGAFKMHNKLYTVGSQEWKNMWRRYTVLTNKPRFPEERRMIDLVYGMNVERFS